MSGNIRTRSTRRSRHRAWRIFHRTAAVTALAFLVAEIAVVAVSSVRPQRAQAAAAPTGQNFTVTPGDLHFIMKQIKIAEQHARTLTASNPCGTLVGSGPDQIPDRLTPYGLRTVDGSCNNLFPQRERFAAADELFPRLATPSFRDAEGVAADALGTGSPAVPSSSYKQKKGPVFDSAPRVVSNLIVDQTSTNPAAVAAAGHPVRSQDPTASAFPCDTDPIVDPVTHAITTPGDPAGCTPKHKTLFIPNVTTDVGLSPPYNSMFTFFGQFFDHGVDQTVKSGATVFVPLRADDPLRTLGPDGDAGHARPGAHEPERVHGAHTGQEPARSRRHPRRPLSHRVHDPAQRGGPGRHAERLRRERRRRSGGDQHGHAAGRPEPDVHVACLDIRRSCASTWLPRTAVTASPGPRRRRPCRDRQACRRLQPAAGITATPAWRRGPRSSARREDSLGINLDRPGPA